MVNMQHLRNFIATTCKKCNCGSSRTTGHQLPHQNRDLPESGGELTGTTWVVVCGPQRPGHVIHIGVMSCSLAIGRVNTGVE